ncbi:dysbindin domain-containing protein 1 [Heteronotia binoei]|uniref:dysbindin domain-containing protein 1 n=1 Tax=Heteronotia binoei TaxID=13085 RepID=UPI00292FD529|nr:dysbindin domain-containing protein 1 [Heteronotia binoei]
MEAPGGPATTGKEDPGRQRLLLDPERGRRGWQSCSQPGKPAEPLPRAAHHHKPRGGAKGRCLSCLSLLSALAVVVVRRLDRSQRPRFKSPSDLGPASVSERKTALTEEAQMPEQATPLHGLVEEPPCPPAEEEGGIPIPTSGLLQVAECRQPLSSVSSLEVHFDLLDLTELTDMSDQELAEVFADSDEENVAGEAPVGLHPSSHPLPRAGYLRSPSWTRSKADQRREKKHLSDSELQASQEEPFQPMEKPKED